MMRRYSNLLIISFSSILAACTISDPHSTEIGQDQTIAQNDTCDDPDAHIDCSFINRPSQLSHIMTITEDRSDGEPMIISGRLIRSDNGPIANAILYAYHTDRSGLYSKQGNETGAQKWHGRHHGWCITDSSGTFELRTIRPGRYPDNSMPAHIHCAVKENSGQTYYINDLVFADDSLVNDRYLNGLTLQGGNGVIQLKRSAEGILVGERVITIGDSP